MHILPTSFPMRMTGLTTTMVMDHCSDHSPAPPGQKPLILRENAALITQIMRNLFKGKPKMYENKSGREPIKGDFQALPPVVVDVPLIHQPSPWGRGNREMRTACNSVTEIHAHSFAQIFVQTQTYKLTSRSLRACLSHYPSVYRSIYRSIHSIGLAVYLPTYLSICLHTDRWREIGTVFIDDLYTYLPTYQPTYVHTCIHTYIHRSLPGEAKLHRGQWTSSRAGASTSPRAPICRVAGQKLKLPEQGL